MSGNAAVSVLLFGPLRERAGVAELSGRGASVREVWERVREDRRLPESSADGIRPARNHEYCEWDTPLQNGDVVAFLPPVAGGSGATALTPVRVNISAEPLDAAAIIEGIGAAADGAVAAFIGRVRENSDGHAVLRLDYEVYRPMAEAELRRIGESLHARGGISSIVIVHRTGTLEVGEASVVIAVAAAHRAAALAACSDAIDMIKRDVPIWKREHRDDGARWVDARQHHTVPDER